MKYNTHFSFMMVAMAIAGLLATSDLLAQPSNDNCWQAEVMPLEAGASIVRTGNNEGATAGQLSLPDDATLRRLIDAPTLARGTDYAQRGMVTRIVPLVILSIATLRRPTWTSPPWTLI